LSFEVHPGQLTVLEGQNGNGKSTLLEICAGLRRPTSGRVQRTVKSSYLPQAAVTLSEQLTGREHALLFGAAMGKSAAFAMSNVASALNALNFSPSDLRVKVGRLSGGNRQKLNLALCFMDRDVSLYLLDEPYSGFDARTLEAMMEFFSGQLAVGKSIVMVNHLTDKRLHVDQTVQVGPV